MTRKTKKKSKAKPDCSCDSKNSCVCELVELLKKKEKRKRRRKARPKKPISIKASELPDKTLEEREIINDQLLVEQERAAKSGDVQRQRAIESLMKKLNPKFTFEKEIIKK